MTTNPAFRRAINSLSHPLAIAAIIVLLINDHLLRQLWPSWWTGKLGDYAWLVFAPLILILLLSWLIPSRGVYQERIVGWVAFMLTGLGFALAKTIPVCTALIIRLLETLTSWSMILLTDPTDLLALPALGIGWTIWQRGNSRSHQALHRWAVIPLAMLATMANMAAPNYGINCLIEEDNGTLLALAQPYGGEYTSRDGGLTWQELPSPAGYETTVECTHHDATWQLSHPTEPQVLYRFVSGKAIERSTDGGQSWVREVDLSHEEPRNAYYKRFRSYAAQPGPFDALFHRSTGQLIVAMAQDGILVRMSEGEWRWVEAGPYHREELSEVNMIAALLTGELWLAALLIPLTVGTMFLPSGQRKWWWFIPSIMAWVLWIIPVILEPAIAMTGYAAALYALPAILSLVIAVPWAVYQAILVYRQLPRALILVGLSAIGEALLFILPYLLWAWGVIPRYTISLGLALSLTAMILVAGAWYLKRLLVTAGKIQ
jgi:hypothetical protein